MRLYELLNETLHDVLMLLKSDAQQLEELGRIELKDDWEMQIPKLAHRYDKKVRAIYNSFEDPEGRDDDEWIQAHMDGTKEFLVNHKLARDLE